MPKCEALDRLHTKLLEAAQKTKQQPTYGETIAHPFLKTNEHTNKMDNGADGPATAISREGGDAMKED